MSKAKRQITKELSKLIEMQPPNWLCKETYEQFETNREQFSKEVKDNFEELIVGFFESRISLQDLQGKYNETWKSYSFRCSPEPLVHRYMQELIISNPTTGQDPKMDSGPNRKTASYHAGRQWGWTPQIFPSGNYGTSSSQWIESGTFNLVKYPGGKVVLEPCNVEHRLWGLIAFPLGLIPIDSKEDIYYYNSELTELYDKSSNKMINRMKVNGMTLPKIVEEAKKRGCITTQDEILQTHFYSNDFNFTILPSYSKEECEQYFTEVNTSSQKTKSQMFHASSEPIMNWAKMFSSPKCVKFQPLDTKYHPLFEMMDEKTELIKLEALMYTFEVISLIDNKYKPIDSTDDKLIVKYEQTHGYNKLFKTEEFKEEVIDRLDFLYSLFSQSENVKMSRQKIQQLLLLDSWLDENNLVIQDRKLFIDNFNLFWDDSQTDNDGDLTHFGRCARSGASNYAKDALIYTKKHFFNQAADSKLLKSIGVVTKSSSLQRTFNKDVIIDSLQDNNGLDLDGTLLTTEPVGAHIIPEMELIRLTDSERDVAFMEEGLGDKFDFNSNCRASSSYHNQRMGVLRMSEYLSIIDDDEKVRQARLQKYNELKAKPILI